MKGYGKKGLLILSLFCVFVCKGSNNTTRTVFNDTSALLHKKGMSAYISGFSCEFFTPEEWKELSQYRQEFEREVFLRMILSQFSQMESVD